MKDFKNGDYVRVRTTGARGRVYRLCNCPLFDHSLRVRTEFGPDPARFINAQWAEVLGDQPYEYFRWPIDLLEEIEPFKLRNPYEREYFAPSDISGPQLTDARATYTYNSTFTSSTVNRIVWE